MNKYNVFIRYIVETRITVEAGNEEAAMKIADKECSMSKTLVNPAGSNVIENQHRCIWRTEIAKK